MLKFTLILLFFVFMGCGEDPQPTKPNVATQKFKFSNNSEVSGSALNVFGGVHNGLFNIQVLVDHLTSPTKTVANRNLQIVFDGASPATGQALSGQQGNCKVAMQLFKGVDGEYDVLPGSVTVLSIPSLEGQTFLVELDIDFYGSALKGSLTVSYGSVFPLYPVDASQQAALCDEVL